MIATILVIFIVGFIIVHHIYKLKDELNEIKEIVSRIERTQNYFFKQTDQQLTQIDYIVSDIEDTLDNIEIKNKYNMEEKIYTEKDLVDFGNYLLSEQRNKTIESEEMKSVVGDWDLRNWKRTVEN